MRKVANFIVEKRKLVLIISLLITICSLFLMTKVNLNDDLTKYLPDDSSMKQGLDIMKGEFSDSASSSFDIMFVGLTDEEKENIYEELSSSDNVSSVDYEAGSKDYNAEGYTLYTVNVDYDENSAEAKTVLDNITATYGANYEIYTRGDIVDANKSALPIWIIALAVFILMIILFAMCASWFEPLLFLATIVIAIIINMGTNAFLGSVSSMTHSIAAILQLVLSMDYSIMLINRYRQELGTTENKYEAMKSALTHAFSTITSSSVTTIVGLLALVFMSFKIGRDMGIVLAKGVLISLLCIYTVLPGLILMFHKTIEKTRKKILPIKLDKLGAFTYKARYGITAVFIVLFAAVILFKGNTSIAYTMQDNNKIDKIFPASDMMVMLYENDDESSVATLASELEQKDNVKSASCYSNTLGKAYTADDLSDAIDSMGSDMNLDTSLFSIVYYDKYSDGKTGELTLQEFAGFIKNEIASNEHFADKIDSDMLEKIDRLSEFTDPKEIRKPLSSAELAKLLEMNQKDLDQLYMYYFSLHPADKATAMTIQTFVKFIKNDVVSNEQYASYFDANTLSQIDALSTYTDTGTIKKQYTSSQMAGLLGMDEGTARQLYSLYYAKTTDSAAQTMTLVDFVDFLAGDVMTDETYAAYFDDTAKAQITSAQALLHAAVSGTAYTSAELAAFTGMDVSQVDQLLAAASATEMTLPDFINYIVNNASASLGEEALTQLTSMQTLINLAVSGQELDASQLAECMNMDQKMVEQLFALRSGSTADTSSMTMSLKDFVDFVVSDVASDEQYASYFSSSALSQMQMMQRLMNAAVSGTELTSSEMTDLLGMNSDTLNLLYAYYTSQYGNTGSWRMSLKDFVDFVVSDVAENDEFSDYFDASSLDELASLQKITGSVLAGDKYSAEGMAGLMSGFSDQMDADTIELAYLYYFSKYDSDPSWTLTPKQFIDYVSSDMMNDARFASYFDADTKSAIDDAQQELDDGIKQLKGSDYSRLIIRTTLPEESASTTTFLDGLTSECDRTLTGNYYLIGNEPMAYEMANSFDSEMNLITLLTAIAIFVVVAITFRSLIIPAVLVLIIQCAVYAMMCVIGIQGYSIYYIALLIVQCLLMGATIDYGILYTTYYREKRATMNIREALIAAYNGSIHTILTSGLIMILVTGILGNFFANPTIGQICQSISKGALCATLLIIFILPGILATFDKVICRKKYKQIPAEHT